MRVQGSRTDCFNFSLNTALWDDITAAPSYASPHILRISKETGGLERVSKILRLIVSALALSRSMKDRRYSFNYEDLKVKIDPQISSKESEFLDWKKHQ